MNKFKLLILSSVFTFIFSSCTSNSDIVDPSPSPESSPNIKEKSMLEHVLSNEKTFITEDGKAVLLKNYTLVFGGRGTPISAKPTEYTFVDFDNDAIDELVINISPDYGFYLILHYNGLDVYGYEHGFRALQMLKTDGSFYGSGGAASSYYCRMSFVDNKSITTYTAVKDSMIGRFEIEGENCSTEKLNEYINDWNLKEDVKWIRFEESDNTIIENESVSSDSNEPQVSTSKTIDLDEYVDVTFKGDNLVGYGSVKFDKEKFLLDHINDISFNKDNFRVYTEIYKDSNKSAATELLRFISVSLDKTGHLSNGDTVRLKWEIDRDKINTYFQIDYTCSTKAYTVGGLSEAESFDPFEEIDVFFSGIAPYGKATVSSYSPYYGDYTISPKENLKNGDAVIVNFSCQDKATMIGNFGKYPSCFEKSYIVSGLKEYPMSITDISSDILSKIDSLAQNYFENRIYTGTFPDKSTITGNIIGYTFLLPVAGDDSRFFAIYKVNISGEMNKEYYITFGFENPLIENGICTMATHQYYYLFEADSLDGIDSYINAQVGDRFIIPFATYK